MWWFDAAQAAGCPEKPAGAVRLLLVGDAGWAEVGDPVLAAASACDTQTDADQVVLLGDNVYAERGFRPWRFFAGNIHGGLRRTHLTGRRQLDAQVDAFAGGSELLVVPGNHDWYAGHAGVTRQRDYVTRDDGSGPRATWFAPFVGDDPCDVSVGVRSLPGVTLLGVDSMAQLRCGEPARAILRDQLQRAAAAETGWLVVAAHHPVDTVGHHAGRSVTGQDVAGGSYRHRWTSALVGLTTEQRDRIVFVSGHDHLLALLPDREHLAMQVVSGAGSAHQAYEAETRLSGVRPGDAVALSDGYVVLDLGAGTGTATLVPLHGEAKGLELRADGSAPRPPGP